MDIMGHCGNYYEEQHSIADLDFLEKMFSLHLKEGVPTFEIFGQVKYMSHYASTYTSPRTNTDYC